MKKLTAVTVVLCMLLSMLPVIGFAANSVTVDAVRTAYFNSGSEWKYTDGDNILVSIGGPGAAWTAPTQFTDIDGTVTTGGNVSGVEFLTARHGLVAFEIPKDFNYKSDMKITLGFTVKNVKQVASGAKLAIYGNSLDGSWDLTSGKEAFGVSGDDPGLTSLEFLGFTTAITTGNQSGESASNEVITFSSMALTEYVKKMAQEGKTEVTFRLATHMGGIRIYDYNTNTPPTMTIEEGEISSVTVKTVFMDGENEVDRSLENVGNLFAGTTYTYTDTPKTTIVKGEDIYVYSAEKSTLSALVEADGTSEIVIYYEKSADVHSFSGYEVEDEGAWCWFGDPRAVNFTNEDGTIDVTVIGYIDVHGSIKATQINNLTNKVDEVLVRTNIQPDDHNNPTFVMVPDGRIVVFYSRHTDEACFWYRVSEEPGDITTFGEEKCLLTSANTTYPSPFILSDDPDHIYLCWRGIEWHPTIAKLSLPDENGNMEFTFGPKQLVRSTNAGDNVRPYAKYASNGKDKIYMSYTSTHPDNISDNWLYFNQIDINTMTMHDINGTLMRTIENGPLIVDRSNQSHIVDKTSGVRNWLWQVAVAEDGTPVIANVRINGGKTSHDYYYVKWDGAKWVKTFLTNAGGKFHPSNTEYCYSGGMSIDTDNPNVIYCSKPVEGLFGKIWEIFKYTMSDDGTSVEATEQITENSLKNNVRPWVIPNSEGKDFRLMWMNGDYDFWMVNSVYPAGYPTSIMSLVPLHTEEADLDDAIINETFDDIGGAFVATEDTATAVQGERATKDAFTVSADVYLDGDYEGFAMFVDSDVKLTVENRATQYSDYDIGDRPRVVLTVGEEEFVSPNVYGTSDEWKKHNVRTGGEYFFSRYDDYQNLTISYDGEYITVYRNGLIDIKEKAAVDKGVFHFVAIGYFDGYVENITAFDRALNHDEIKLLSENDYEVKDPDVEGTDTVNIIYKTTTEKVLYEDTITLNPRTTHYNFNPEDNIIVDGVVYSLADRVYNATTGDATAIYQKMVEKGENLVPVGSFEDKNGNFSWGTWQTPRTDTYNNEYFANSCNDWFYVVNGDTNSAALYDKNNIAAADNYVLGTRWNDGVQGLCSMANFIPVEAGKTYRVAYDYKHKNAGVNSAYISTAFVKDKSFALNTTGNNIPVDVTTEWQTNEFVITAPEDGYIYFHFSWVGSGGSTNTSDNSGNGPYWYFDNFEVFELETEAIKAEILSSDATQTLVKVENVSVNKIEDIKVYAVSVEGDTVTNCEVRTIALEANQNETLTFNVTGNVKVYVWNNDMQPLYDVMEN